MLIGGTFTEIGGVERNRIARLNSDGTLDTGFNPNSNGLVFSILIQPDSNMLIAGQFTTIGGVERNGIARLNSDGTLDTGFNPNANDEVDTIAIQSDGKIIVGGDFTEIGEVGRNGIARLNSDGTLDTEFNPIIDGFIKSVSIQEDNKILISGVFDEVNGVARRRIARLNSDGTLDPSFNIIYVENFGIEQINTIGSGKIVVFGYFTQMNGVSRNSIALFKEIVDNAPYKLIYIVPSNTNAILGSIFSTNHNDFPVFYDIAVVPYEDSLVSEKHYYIWDNLLEDNNFEVLKDKLTLSAGDKIYVYSSTDENISFNIFGTEITG